MSPSSHCSSADDDQGGLMGRPASGSLDAIALAGDLRAFQLRFTVAGRRERLILHEAPGCTCGCGGGWDERAARNELGNILARVRVGIWEPPEPPPAVVSPAAETPTPTFADYASWWLQAKIDGALGTRGGLRPSTAEDYRWRLGYLLRFFGAYPLDAIDGELCLAFKARMLREASELRAMLEAGADLRGPNNRPLRPLGLRSIRHILDTLAAVLDDAVEDGHLAHNPARSKRMRLSVPKPRRTFLEMDELAALLDAAAAQDATYQPPPPSDLGPTTRLIAHLHAQGLTPTVIARRLGIAKSTVSWHLRRLGVEPGRRYAGRRVVCEILGRAGVRVGELCELRIGQMRLHDPNGARFHIPDAKTEAGIREVQMTPDLVEAVVEHIDRLQRAGHPTGPDAYLVQNTRGGQISRQRVGEVLRDATAGASRRLAAQGMPPLPHVTAHTLRRTYISIALLANNFDVKWVMSQVGHTDSKMTLDVYAQLEQRVDRRHGENFDRLMRAATVPALGLGVP
jgi:integrase